MITPGCVCTSTGDHNTQLLQNKLTVLIDYLQLIYRFYSPIW